MQVYTKLESYELEFAKERSFYYCFCTNFASFLVVAILYHPLS